MNPPSAPRSTGIDVLHLSLHGLIRGENLELGRDPDTGGQVLYVVELVKALSEDAGVRRVSLITRKVIDSKVSPDYAVAREDLGNGAEILRIEAGPRRYLRKEVLWRHLDAFIDGTLTELRRERRVPDLVHAHYADAGYVGRQIAAVLGCPFIYTGHSLGRVKRERLIESGTRREEIEQKYNMATRIEAEELSLDAAALVCTSTRQEVEKQYSLYDQYPPQRMRVIPPGVNLARFDGDPDPKLMEVISEKLRPFLRDLSRQPVFTIARADERKNLGGLVRAFAANPWLRENANLILIGGNRSTLENLTTGARRVWLELLRLIDDGDLYGITAYPKHHASHQVAGFFRWCASRHGVFVNPAFTEPFGLTLLEASAAGLPLVATEDGGPRDIIANCGNGILIDPLDQTALGNAIEKVLRDSEFRAGLVERGHHGVREHYSWSAHVRTYLKEVTRVLAEAPGRKQNSASRKSLVERERWIVMDLPPHIENEPPALVDQWRDLFEDSHLGFGVASGLSFEEIWAVIQRCGMPGPAFAICGLGAEIRYGENGTLDETWSHRLAFRWNREDIIQVLATAAPELQLQEESYQHRFKISYLATSQEKPNRGALQRLLREAGLAAKVLVTARTFVDVIPIRSGKDVALRYLENRWGIDPSRIFYFGNYGNDAAAVRGRNLSAVAADADRVLLQSQPRPRLYHAQAKGIAALFEGLEHYGFLEGDKPPGPTEQPTQGEENVPKHELHP